MTQVPDHLRRQIEDKSHAIVEDMLAPGETDEMKAIDWLHVTLDHLDQEAMSQWYQLRSEVGEDQALQLLVPFVTEP
jgi:hypothetical protein